MPAKPTSTTALESAIESMDAISQEAFGGITAIAKLTLALLETPKGYHQIEEVAQALSTIWSLAERAENTIHDEAGTVGCFYENDASERRCAARQTFLRGVCHG